MDTDSFIMHLKTEDVFKDIVNDVEKKNGSIMTELVELRPKAS